MNASTDSTKGVHLKSLIRIVVLIALQIIHINAYPASYYQQNDEPLAEMVRSTIQNEAFNMNVLLQGGFRFSMYDDDFQGGRTFEAANARISIRGKLDRGFYYRLQVNMVREPNLLDAFIGYKAAEAFRIKAGAMKPIQSLDLIPGAAHTGFVDRTIIARQLVPSRDIGISAEGDIKGFYYFAGLFNGNRLEDNNNNKFYGIGRIHYNFDVFDFEKLQLGIQGSHGDSPGVISGSRGPMLRGERTIFGVDLKLETNKVLFIAEYISGEVEIDNPDAFFPGPTPVIKEKISGYYFIGGYKILESTMILARWQSWGYKEADWHDNQLTLGINHDFTSTTRLKFNFDSYFPDDGENMYGFSLILQVYI